jgi:hypothetical protein
MVKTCHMDSIGRADGGTMAAVHAVLTGNGSTIADHR